MGHAITARGLTRRFASLTAVENLDLVVPSGQIFGLVGPDGAGKTTTIRILVGVMDPTSGSVVRQLDHAGTARPGVNAVSSVLFLSRGKRFATLGIDPVLRVWDTATGNACYAVEHRTFLSSSFALFGGYPARVAR